MNLHEYQGKQLFAEYGLPVSKGFAVDTPEEAAAACEKIGGSEWVVKAQVHAGGRGKAGGVKLVKSKEDAKAFAAQWLGKNLVTYQTDANGQPVSKILVESCTDIDKELYLGAVVDRSSRRIVFMASTEGGVDIEKVAHDTPEKILKATIDPLVGAQPFQGRELAFQLGLQGDQIKQFTHIFVGLAKLFQDHDLALLGFDGPPMPALTLGDSNAVRDGQDVAMTGFPLGGSIGIVPVTHKGIVSALTPVGQPLATARQLDSKTVRRLSVGNYQVLQLDIVSYPGNSGSPLYDPATGEVIGVLNMVFVKSTKEKVLSDPSGISYAIPIEYLQRLIAAQR